MKNIEVEIQSLVSGKDWVRLRKFFDKKAKFLGEHHDKTSYFEKNGRIRIRIEPRAAYFISKSGKMHDKAREEIEIKFSKKDVLPAEEFLKSLGFPLQIRWSRRRRKYLWDGITVTLDDSKGYGKLIELEKMSDMRGRKTIQEKLLKKFKLLKIPMTSRKILDQRFRNYLKTWRRFF